VLLIAVISLLMIGTVSPSPARADGTEVAIVASAVVVGYVAAVFIATALVYRRPLAWTEAGEDLQMDGKHPPAALRFGPHCRQSPTALTLACW
jgi:hypothetical protein